MKKNLGKIFLETATYAFDSVDSCEPSRSVMKVPGPEFVYNAGGVSLVYQVKEWKKFTIKSELDATHPLTGLEWYRPNHWFNIKTTGKPNLDSKFRTSRTSCPWNPNSPQTETRISIWKQFLIERHFEIDTNEIALPVRFGHHPSHPIRKRARSIDIESYLKALENWGHDEGEAIARHMSKLVHSFNENNWKRY